MKLDGKVLFGTGHRPHKLGPVPKYRLITTLAVKEIAPDWGITGMALGFDTAIALSFIMLGIKFVAAVPFKEQTQGWKKDDLAVYDEILTKAALVHYVSAPGYSPWKYQVRNQWMVDNATEGLSLFDGSVGGTKNCLGYAKFRGIPVTNIWERCLASN